MFDFLILYRYAESVGAVHMHTSAKANRGLDEIFGALAQSTFRLTVRYVVQYCFV
jgi:hypothetical protein